MTSAAQVLSFATWLRIVAVGRYLWPLVGHVAHPQPSCSLDVDMPMSPEARCLAMGVPLAPFNHHYACPFERALRQLAPNPVAKLIGNAVHGHAFLAFMMYMLSNLARREQVIISRCLASNFSAEENQDVSWLMGSDDLAENAEAV